MDLLLATNNSHKADEIRAMLSDRFGRIYTLKEKKIDLSPDENGATFTENALIKARAFSALTDLPVLADDSGLVVEALGGEPGIRSARYAGENSTDADNNAKLMMRLEGVKDRRARFECRVVLLFNGKYLVGTGTTEGEILSAPSGVLGFGYDPYFYSYDLKKSFATASPAEKNSVSHRGRAIKDLLQQRF
ncbi:MAG: RdgB/HAM1 family non-canonical purine NTP pyrophosphatase [Clostridiales bacterium]|jgi:XTP/dITP diphosphohydrolase|nr:RdgB/HAM1 family non-canonical purine NTP pyrophosphatase [Clostridiales bacterium]